MGMPDEAEVTHDSNSGESTGTPQSTSRGSGSGDRRLVRLSATPALVAQTFVLLAVFGALLLGVSEGHGVAFPDEGVYAAQAESLAEGHWFEERPAPRLPDVESLNGIGAEWTDGLRYVAYAKHSSYVRLLAPFYRVWGFAGLLVPSILAGSMAALAAAILARRIQPRLASPALWMTGLASPLLFDSLLVAAHALAAATCGWAAVGLARSLLDRRTLSLVWGLPLVAATALLRSEGAVAMAALGGAIGLVGLVSTYRTRRAMVPPILVGSLVVLVAAGAYFLDATLSRHITGSTEAVRTVSRFTGGDREYLPQIWASLFRPWYSERFPQPIVGLGSICVALAALLHRIRGARRSFVTLAILGFGAACLLSQILTAREYVTGLFAAMPLLLAGLLLLRHRDITTPPIAVALLTAAVTTVGIVLSGYTEGGAAEWGGRFYAVLLPLLVPVAMLGLSNAFDELPVGSRRIAVGSVVVIGLAMATIAAGTNADRRDVNREFERATISSLRDSSSQSKPLVILGGTDPGGTSRTLWAHRDRIELLVAPTVVALYGLTAHAADFDYPEVSVVAPLSDESARELEDAWLEPIGWHRVLSTPVGDTGWILYVYGPHP